MDLKYIIATLILSDFYLTMPLKERQALVQRLYTLYGRHPYGVVAGESGDDVISRAAVRVRE
ncbi:MAG: hypothetical protein JRG72_05670 [Deltaproteobacteria bacterium]|nr:hypothetical protein [Deltaproteobacteria bacterium]